MGRFFAAEFEELKYNKRHGLPLDDEIEFSWDLSEQKAPGLLVSGITLVLMAIAMNLILGGFFYSLKLSLLS